MVNDKVKFESKKPIHRAAYHVLKSLPVELCHETGVIIIEIVMVGLMKQDDYCYDFAGMQLARPTALLLLIDQCLLFQGGHKVLTKIIDITEYFDSHMYGPVPHFFNCLVTIELIGEQAFSSIS